ncbi:hypothetical protein H8711_04485 [Clostridiaceae bacterium NSJ-31]|uniref:Uncharacterized protein n=1 Tax=Ligaoa zhengdingensis TaxID=2763658 RepID=A0A926DYK2_9FIRM|nr:OadG-related small transporter subunit [Ligaoa zhengdingensis]MBC8546192.1 hypothetical protein [Ligaoa zhengdingensis]
MNELFMQSLVLMGKGMLGIFVVIFIIYLIILALTKLTAGKKTGDE